MSIPTPRICWSIVIDSTNDTIRLHESSSNFDGGPIAHGTYYTPEAVLYAFQVALNSALAGGGRSCVFTLSASGIVTLNVTTGDSGHTYTLKWGTAPYGAIGVLLGFSAASTPADQSSSSAFNHAVFTGDQQIKQCWIPGMPVRSDSRPGSSFSRSIVRSTGGVVAVDLAGSQPTRTIQINMLIDRKIFTANEVVKNEALQHLFDAGYARFLYFPDASSMALSSAVLPADRMADQGNGLFYSLDEQTAQEFKPKRTFVSRPLYDLDLVMVGTN